MPLLMNFSLRLRAGLNECKQNVTEVNQGMEDWILSLVKCNELLLMDF